ncbi:MAG: triphosphoribosyl-dephospho-CoA synthase [Planctomycetales bacterium]
MAVFSACVLDVLVAKPGNVHQNASFHDLTWVDFRQSAEQICRPFEEIREQGLGRTIYAAIEATRKKVASNTNLGIVLLLAPLAMVPWEEPLKESNIGAVLGHLTVEDACWTYKGIALAQPGGMGKAKEQDVSEVPTVTLLEAMQMAADRDSIAAQYTTNYELVREAVEAVLAPGNLSLEQYPADAEQRILRLALWLIYRAPDTLIARKCGPETAHEAARRAADVLESGIEPERLSAFDAWLRADGNRRNPGTTADLVVACLYYVFRNRIWPLPPTRKIADLMAAEEMKSTEMRGSS